MAVILEVKAGPFTGRKISLSVGQVFLVGRTAERAQFAVPHDNLMSGVHFAIECGPSGSSVIDKGSTNGTYLNGAKIQKAMFLSNGDEIKSGQTIFVVRIVSGDAFSALPFSPVSASQPPAPSSSQHPGQAPALTIGSWAFHKIPNGWQIQERLGIQQVVKDAFPSSIGAIEEPLGPGLTLQHYVDAHTKMFREHLRDPKISVAVPPVIHGSVETAALEIQYSPKEGPSIFFRRDYARHGSILGVLTLTTLEKDLPSIRLVYDSVLSAVSFSHDEQV